MKNAEHPLISVPCRIKFLYTKYPNGMLHSDNLFLHDKYVELDVSLPFFKIRLLRFFNVAFILL